MPVLVVSFQCCTKELHQYSHKWGLILIYEAGDRTSKIIYEPNFAKDKTHPINDNFDYFERKFE